MPTTYDRIITGEATTTSADSSVGGNLSVTGTSTLTGAVTTAGLLTVTGGGGINFTTGAAVTVGTTDAADYSIKRGGVTKVTVASSVVNIVDALSVGTNAAAAGAVRLPNNTEFRGRNAANAADVRLLGISTDDRVQLAPGGADIQWGVTLIALGGGAAPTFGTIGGSGPATAGQNAWLRVVDSTGSASWIPVWK